MVTCGLCHSIPTVSSNGCTVEHCSDVPHSVNYLEIDPYVSWLIEIGHKLIALTLSVRSLQNYEQF